MESTDGGRLLPRRQPFPFGLDQVELNERRAKSRERLWSSLTILVSGGIAAIATTRLLTISRWDYSTALGILGATSTATIVFGAILTAFPFVLASLTAHLAYTAMSTSGHDSQRLWTWYVVGATIVFLLTSPLYLTAVSVPPAVVLASWILRRFFRRRQPKHQKAPPDASWLRCQPPPNDRLLQHYRQEHEQVEQALSKLQENTESTDESLQRDLQERLVEIGRDGNSRVEEIDKSGRSGLESATLSAVIAFLPLALQYINIGDRPWMPAEMIRTQDQVVVGYVVSQDPRWVTVLKDSDRTIHIFATPRVTGREVCEIATRQNDQRPLLSRLSSRDQPDYPPCAAPQ